MRRPVTIGFALIVLIVISFAQPAFGDETAPARQKTTGPENPADSLYQQGKQLYEIGKISKAVLLWEKVHQINPDYPEVRLKLFEAYKFLGIEKYNQNLQGEAIAVWEKAARLNPGDEDIKDYVERCKSEINKLEELSPEKKTAADNEAVPEKKPETKRKPAAKPEKKNTAEKKSPEINYSREIDNLYDSLAVLAENIRKLSAENAAPPPPDTFDKLRLAGFIETVEYNDHRLRRATFKIDQVELNLSSDISKKTAFRADIEFVTDSLDEFKADIEQGFIDWKTGSNGRWMFTFGKFNAPFGRQPVDAPDREQYSAALVYQYGRPVNVLGLLITHTCSPALDWSLYLVNGWDVNVDNNKDKTIGARLRVRPFDEISCGFSVLTGPERDDNNSSRRSVFNFDLELWPSHLWRLAGEVNFGLETKAFENAAQADWLALALFSRLDIGGRAGLSARFDFLSDREGLLTGTTQDLKALSLAPSLSLTDNMTARLEGRCDFSDREVFLGADDAPHDYRITTVLELIYRF